MKDKQQNDLFLNKFISVAINALSISSRLEHFITVILKKFNLTLPQFNALWVLVLHYPDPIPLNKLTESMIDKSSNTSRLVDKLVEKNLALRQVATHDRRVIHLSITETGLTLANQATGLLESSLAKRISPSEKNETEDLIQSLKILRGYHKNNE